MPPDQAAQAIEFIQGAKPGDVPARAKQLDTVQDVTPGIYSPEQVGGDAALAESQWGGIIDPYQKPRMADPSLRLGDAAVAEGMWSSGVTQMDPGTVPSASAVEVVGAAPVTVGGAAPPGCCWRSWKIGVPLRHTTNRSARRTPRRRGT